MDKISIRYQRVSDAERFYEILSNPNLLKYFPAKPKSLNAEREWLKLNAVKRRKNTEYNYAIICDGNLIGGAGIMLHPKQKHICEIGYFIDEPYWGRGITTKVVRMLEKIAFNKLKLRRIEIHMDVRNKASERVAIKAGYIKEGLMRKSFNNCGKLVDDYLYAKVR
jgi:ribosomal-protein-alanine N-acetyltransferase